MRNCTIAEAPEQRSGQVDLSSSFSHCSLAQMQMPQFSADLMHLVVSTQISPNWRGMCLHVCKSQHVDTGSLLGENTARTTSEQEKSSHCCIVCWKKFSKIGNLKIHQCFHTGQKPHVCMECGRHFIKKKDLKNYKWAWSIQERNHISATIVERFSQGENLKRHQKKSTLERMCEMCDWDHTFITLCFCLITITKTSLNKQNNHVTYFIVILAAVTIFSPDCLGTVSDQHFREAPNCSPGTSRLEPEFRHWKFFLHELYWWFCVHSH